MTENKEVPIIACFFQSANGAYRLNQLYALKDPQAGTLGALFGSIRMYDVDWCNRDQSYLWHMSGCGGTLPIEIDGPYWSRLESDVRQVPSTLCDADSRRLNQTRRLAYVPIDLDDCVDILHYLECNGIQQDAVWCSACEDHLPGEDLCEHCWWCDTAGWYVTPGDGEICFSVDCWDCRNRRRSKHEAYRDEKRSIRFKTMMDSRMAKYEGKP